MLVGGYVMYKVDATPCLGAHEVRFRSMGYELRQLERARVKHSTRTYFFFCPSETCIVQTTSMYLNARSSKQADTIEI